MNTKLELKRSIMLSYGLRLSDQALDEMQLVETAEGYSIRFKALVRASDWKGCYGSSK